MEKVPYGVSRELVTEDLPAGSERRLVLRLLAYWRDLQREQEYPSCAAIDPDKISDMWRNSFVLETVGNENDPLFRTFGDEIAGYCGVNLIGKHVSETPPNTLAAKAVEYFGEVLEKGTPISRGGEFTKDNGTLVLYRSILLPMSDDGETIGGLLGGANCREVEPD
jgi:hypothetical protein